jgi:hypothetical protein
MPAEVASRKPKLATVRLTGESGVRRTVATVNDMPRRARTAAQARATTVAGRLSAMVNPAEETTNGHAANPATRANVGRIYDRYRHGPSTTSSSARPWPVTESARGGRPSG